MKIFQRLFDTVLFRSATYREIAENANLWLECAPLVVVFAIASSSLYTQSTTWRAIIIFAMSYFVGGIILLIVERAIGLL